MRNQTIASAKSDLVREEPGAASSQNRARTVMKGMMRRARGLGKIAKLRRLAKDILKFLALPLLALVTNVFWETIGFGAESILTALNLQLWVVLVVLSLPVPIVKVVKEVRRTRRLRKLTKHVEPRLTLGELRELRLCRGSGRSALKARHWGKDRCQHCFRTPELIDNRIKDHIIARAYIGVMPVECDPRLIAIQNR